ncbi:MAG: hypothetical protein J0L92_40220 [Deltaproteobacteria bacterium]|nr:hypothetical protein [Deltaproteobacteria bacterium]
MIRAVTTLALGALVAACTASSIAPRSAIAAPHVSASAHKEVARRRPPEGCTALGPWAPMPWAPVGAPSDAAVTELPEGNTLARFYTWTARGRAMGELRWSRWDGSQWTVQGSGPRPWPRSARLEAGHEVVIATDTLAVLRRANGSDAGMLGGIVAVSSTAAPRTVPFTRMDFLDDAIADAGGSVFLHLRAGRRSHRILQLSSSGAVVARRDFTVDELGIAVARDGARIGLLASSAAGSRFLPFDGSASETSTLRRLDMDEHGRRVWVDTQACDGPTAGLQLSTTVLWNVAELGIDDAYVSLETRGASTCVREVTGIFFESDADGEGIRSVHARPMPDGTLLGSIVLPDGRSRPVRCTRGVVPGPRRYPTDGE